MFSFPTQCLLELLSPVKLDAMDEKTETEFVHYFIYNNLFYKNIEMKLAKILENVKNILKA